MGGTVSSLKQDLVATQRELAIKSRLLDLKQKKRERDIQQSMQMAASRDRVWWFGAFYTVMGGKSSGGNVLVGIRSLYSDFLRCKQVSRSHGWL